ncbi:ABC transporter substrate-binding protein [Glaciimonas sp. CA11.2]|uniref:ABC transporter substrate-binding protein n=1 Tax=unclassified Glaciimonas TaxID=2644401 RepID=UPI002AB3EF95|nr:MULTISPECIES: ABC transporter substrate-binding protein [unclassified Glaciimonas]MDY7547713.1 ABC transporter substrate-binding protein [Glaciimonas sp. CA11.2]MEB0012967.1 ABC transporter substrate-binding protein [Glaciimonas sp. Cout2]MEB0161370.1 ABC transporter substrate-binding protein [Glaciimonas sp. CA11.2]
MTYTKKWWARAAQKTLLASLLLLQGEHFARAGDQGYGKVGQPVHLVVGYQPYDTVSYSAAVIRGLALWKKFLPAGSEVEFQAGLQGSIIVNQMLAGKQQIGYLGDVPAVLVTTKTEQAKVKLVVNTGFSAGQRCNVIMVRADAPDFKTSQDAIKWLDGKTIATPKGSCADRFLGNVIDRTHIKPDAIMNQSLEVLSTNLRAKKLDAVALWEPTASRIGNLVGEGIAKYAITGYPFDIPDSGYIAMRDDFMTQRPDVVKAWVKMEMEAQRFILDPKNQLKVAEIVKGQTTGITLRMAWFSIYGAIPVTAGGSPIRDEKPFVFDERVHKQLNSIYTFLHQSKVINVGEAPAGSLDDSVARAVANEAGTSLPLGSIKAQDIANAPK